MTNARILPTWSDRGARVLLALAAASTAALLSASCAGLDDPVVLGTPDRDAAIAPPPLVPTDGGANADVAVEALRCIGTQCPYPYATCASSGGRPPFKCQHDLLTDNENCGACGNQCPAYPEFGVLGRCSNGACEPQCQGDRRDCNLFPDDGCETEILFDPKNCGGCGIACAPGVRCVEGICGCPLGKTDCGGSCVDLSSDDLNCGACLNFCVPPDDAGPPPPHMRYGCAQGKCGQLICESTWSNCNGLIADGCEVDVQREIAPGELDPENCGACGVACAPGEACRRLAGGAITCRCKGGETMCGYPGAFVCADTSSNPKHCGLCNYECPFFDRQDIHQQATCIKGLCGTACEPGWGDCNDNPADGCETNLRYDGANCGACGVRCNSGLGQPCIDGRCLTVECDAGDPVTR